MTYSPPASAIPYTLSVSDQDLSDCHTLLRLSNLGPPTWENTQTEHNYGITRQWLSDARDHWLTKFDWRAQEAHINSFANYKMSIDGSDVHFIGHFSAKQDAVPIILMHGWPGSFIEFLPMLDLVRKQYPSQQDLPYHLVVPSLPGYTLSAAGSLGASPSMWQSAKVCHQLMLNLGFKKYIAQGGDVGSFLAKVMATTYEECVAIHLNLFTVAEQLDLEKLDAGEKKGLEQALEFRKRGSAYQQIHATKPATIGHVVQSTPLAVLAWIGEKFLAWSDTPPSLDHILLNVALYWFTNGFPTSIYPYRELFGDDGSTRSATLFNKIEKPTGVSYFAQELFPMPEYAVAKHCKLVHYKKHAKGGHFAALEEPEAFWGDVEEFVRVVWAV
ncbi:hypothetical protein E8E13_003040 [Curvularia kusanoi]|uniref:Epoxide hydrolase N-terminal domain-containing protein n=1 Tax=Curvularia kusanoi TaxID=90978 RepID=A0A9P4T6Q1_CURKU|nr:hypothetical protein E8E13_003040 [Curvularia kusanoi]